MEPGESLELMTGELAPERQKVNSDNDLGKRILGKEQVTKAQGQEGA